MTRPKPYVVMLLASSGENRTTETRYGRRFASIDAAARLAQRMGGLVYEHVSGFGLKLSTINFPKVMR